MGIDHVVGTSLDMSQHAVFDTADIAVAHERDMLSIDAYDAVHHITTTFHPCQYDVADSRCTRLMALSSISLSDIGVFDYLTIILNTYFLALTSLIVS